MSIDKTFEGRLRGITGDITELQRRLRRRQVTVDDLPELPWSKMDPDTIPDLSLPARLRPSGADVVSSFRGTTAQRNAIYGTPSTDAQRVTLANRKIVWFNTDLGWEESYYAPTGLSGLTARGLVAGTTADWYPSGRGPRAVLFSKGAQSRSSGQHFTNYDVFGVGASYRNCSGAYLNFETPGNDGRMVIKIAGQYEIVGNLGMPTGTGTAVISMRVNKGDGSAHMVYRTPAPLLGSYSQQFPLLPETVYVPANAYAFLYLDAGTLQMGTGRTFLSAEYVGPALVSL